jgi:acyl-CoA hydrolase
MHYLVTEHGVAYLHGRSLRERAEAIIGIAHPDDRERLAREAREVLHLRVRG